MEFKGEGRSKVGLGLGGREWGLGGIFWMDVVWIGMEMVEVF